MESFLEAVDPAINKQTINNTKEDFIEFESIIPDNKVEYYQLEVQSDKIGWFHSLTNNLRFSFKSGINKSIEEYFHDSDDPVILLGEIFETKFSKEWSLQEFRNKYHEIIWVSYRSHFRPMLNAKKNKQYTSDVGWGCALRVGQMLLLNTLKFHFNLHSAYYELIKTIEENLISAPYSIHNIIQLGGQGKYPGEWFSPIEICASLQKLLKMSPCKRFQMVMCMDSMIYKDEIYALACDTDIEFTQAVCKCNKNNKKICTRCNLPKVSLEWKNGILILIPLMLGRKKLDPRYFELLKLMLSIRYSVGIIGEKPNSAMYIVGFHRNHAIVLDPHHVKKACSSFEDFKERIGEYFSHELITIKFKDLGSSMSVGFYIRNSAEFNDFEQVLNGNNDIVGNIISIKEKTINYDADGIKNDGDDADLDDDDDFVIL